MPLARRACLTLALIASLAAITYSQTANADPELQLGINAFKEARYDEAILHFENAARNNPQSITPHMYLGTAYAQDYIPGSQSPENRQKAQLAIAQYERVLDLDPSNLNAVKGIAYLYLNMKEFEKAKSYYERSIEIDPKDPESYYAPAVIDWTVTYQRRMDVRSKLGLAPEKSLIGYSECWELRSDNVKLVADGIEKLKQAIELRKDYDDAMAYMNLMYRERADIQCGDRRSYQADIARADKWVDLTMAVKKAKSERRPVDDVTRELPEN